MSHNELLNKINNYDSTEFVNLIKALRSVVEFHMPEKQDHDEYEKCWNCGLIYPCPTIYAIEKELQ